jgi:hypothetical protein
MVKATSHVHIIVSRAIVCSQPHTTNRSTSRPTDREATTARRDDKTVRKYSSDDPQGGTPSPGCLRALEVLVIAVAALHKHLKGGPQVALTGPQGPCNT